LLRVGGTKPLHSDFRLIAATNRDLSTEVAAGNFREDLFYRINVVPLRIPPLRERKEDIPVLARHFFRKHSRKYGFHETSRLTPEDEERLKGHSWPGNVRELENTIERAVVISSGKAIEVNLPMEKTSGGGNPFSDLPTMDELQRRYIRHVISKTEGKIGGKDGAADILGMKRTSLNSRIKKLGLR
jgi:formate hydrogenlyase transcriptional activator